MQGSNALLLYKGEINKSLETKLYIAQLWALGDKYNVNGLKKYIHRVQRKYISLENVVGVYADADILDVEPLKEICLTVMGKDLKKLLNEIEQLPEDMLVRMLRGLIVHGVSL